MNKFQVVYFCRSYAHIKFYYFLLQKYKPEEIELFVCNRDIEKYFQSIDVVYKGFDYPFFDLSKKYYLCCLQLNPFPYIVINYI